MAVGSLGAGSGIDLESLVKQMVSAQKDVKVKLYQDKINGYEAEFSALGQVGSAIDNFKSSVQALNNDDLFTGRDAKIAQKEGEEVVSITTDNTASNGSYAIDVNQLAKGSRIMSAQGLFSSADEVITKEDAQLIFKAGSHEFSINVDAGTTLSELRNQINTSEDNFGVSANLIDDGNGNLFFTATSSIQGAGNTLKISNTSIVRDEDGNIIDNSKDAIDVKDPIEEQDAVEKSNEVADDAKPVDEPDELDLEGDDVDFANDGPIPADEEKDIAETASAADIEPVEIETDDTDNTEVAPFAAGLTLDSVSTEGMTAGLYAPLGEEARDAVITVDGIQIRNQSNTFDDAVAGLSIEALAPTDKTTKVDISFDQKTVQETIEAFVASYNDMVGFLQASTDKDAVLNGNSMIRTLQSSLSTQLMSSHGEAGTFTSVFDLGIKMDNKGMLSFNNAKFDDAMKRGYSEIAPMISGKNGLAQSLENLLSSYTGSAGMTNTLKDSLTRSIDNTEETLEAYEDRMVRYEESLRSKFAGLDSRLANMNAQGGYLNSVLAKM
ncbi:flagellar filament capping protein FliD [Marinomonas sp. M1K-6]|uniref:Flagellar hook-associated protein 2 n=1 Tax=Marinomonas profundi TaxID=2726122 RepID=A0A847REV3_9GAMM|nr:flagellar filament capping protein FliD [Marinomonas profundi]NLQ18800.1 flagellar filament capping protein FliD [Marinomonas profundi]UDV02267.1 flagellar filament capping protein FliD [Marinomonas profundi]